MKQVNNPAASCGASNLQCSKLQGIRPSQQSPRSGKPDFGSLRAGIKTLLPILLIIMFLLTGCGEEYDSSYDEFPSTEGDLADDLGNSSSNPICAYPTIEKAQNAIGFAFAAPNTPPTGYTLAEISVVKDNDTSFAQINYKKESYNITYRVSQTKADLNADRNKYDKEKTIIVSDADIICSCNDDIVFVATWQKDGCFYCIMSDEGMDTTALSIMIMSIQSTTSLQ